MADEPSKSNGSAPVEASDAASQADASPKLNVLLQYIRDLSFESPKAPQAFVQSSKDANIEIQLQVNAQQLADNDHEVALRVEVNASDSAKETIFNVELIYAGVFRMENLAEDQIQPVAMVECPRLLFPFVRQIIADVTRNGGFPPLMIDPVDFLALYQKRLLELKNKQPPSTEPLVAQ